MTSSPESREESQRREFVGQAINEEGIIEGWANESRGQVRPVVMDGGSKSLIELNVGR